MSWWQITFGALAGLVLFLFGIEHFSREIQAVAGERFRTLLGRLTKRPLSGALLGAVTTMIVQSSSATTVIAVGLVDAGTISFAASLGVIFGANVGTTVTAQLVALKLTHFAPFFVVAGFATSLFGRRYRFFGRPIFYFGLVFLALSLVSDAIAPLRENPDVPRLLGRFSSTAPGLLAGFVFTVVVQSSSVTTGLVVLLTEANVLNVEQAIPMLLGANLGTTTTALLGSARMSLHARRAALAHTVFNVGGVLLFLPFLGPFADLVRHVGGDPARQVANAHLMFNASTAVVFLALLPLVRRVVERLVSGDEEEILFETRYLQEPPPKSTREALEQVEHELGHLFDVTARLFDSAMVLTATPSPQLFRLVDKLEALNDFLDRRIETALLQLSKRALEPATAERVVMWIRVSNELEQLGDTASDVADIARELERAHPRLPDSTRAGLIEVNAVLKQSFDILAERFPGIDSSIAERVKRNQRHLRNVINTKYEGHVRRLAREEQYHGTLLVDALSKVESASNRLREIRKQLESPSMIQG